MATSTKFSPIMWSEVWPWPNEATSKWGDNARKADKSCDNAQVLPPSLSLRLSQENKFS